MTSTCIGLGVMSKVISRVVERAVDRARAVVIGGGVGLRRVVGGGVVRGGGR